MEQIDLFAVVAIPLYNSEDLLLAEALVDACDADFVVPFRWLYLHAGKGYAYRSIGSRRNGTYQIVLMHREIMGLPRKKDGQEVDHLNRNGLDNRRGNLRVLTHAQNQQNISSQRGSTSKYRGVHWSISKKRWIAQVRSGGRIVFWKSFNDEEAANISVIEARKRIFPFTVEAM